MGIWEQYYSSARQELITRITLRDSTLGGYLAFLAVVLGLVFRETGEGLNSPVLFAIPYISSVVGVIVSQHHLLIGRIGQYIKEELAAQLPHDSPKVSWDRSSSLFGVLGFATWSRTITHAIVLQGSACWSLYVTFGKAWQPANNLRTLWLGGLVLTVVSFAVAMSCEVMRWEKAPVRPQRGKS